MRRYSSAAVSMWYWLPATRTMAITRATTDWSRGVRVKREGAGGEEVEGRSKHK